MSFDYINEAFKKLDALNEDVFDASLSGMNALSDFMDQDDASDIVKVIDPDAETEEALSDSYIGKVIINCNVCHSHIFEAKEDVVLDDDGVVNPEMQCPYCGETAGFTIVGEIKPFEQETPAEEEAPEAETIEDEATLAGDEVEEDPVVTESDNKLTEGFNFDTVMSDIETLKGFLRSKGHTCNSKEAITYLWSVIDLFEAGDKELTPENLEDWYAETCRNFPEDLELFENVDEGLLGDINVNLDARGFGGEGNNVSVLGGKVPFTKSEDIEEALLGAIPTAAVAVGAAISDALNDDLQDPKTENPEELNEDIQNLSLTTDDTQVKLTSDENGKVTLVTEPLKSEDTSASIAPVSDETVAEITANNDIAVDDAEEIPADEGEDVDIELDEVDEEGLDELGESYLKTIYENVNSFKTTAVSTNDTQMIVEGVITFSSGVKKNTGFVFEARSASSDGCVKFVGKNTHFSESADAFALTGKVCDKKLLPESLTYNYVVGTNKISGTVRKQ